MAAAHYSISFGATLSGATTVSAGQVLVRNDASTYVLATTANRTTYGRAHGIALTSYSGSDTGSVDVQHTGIVPNAITNLGAGAASWVRVSATGGLERVTPAAADDIIGYVNAYGDLNVMPFTPFAATATLPLSTANGGTGMATPGASGNVLKSNGTIWTSGTVSGPNGACTLEQFGAVGDGVTNDTTAWTTALDALKAGTYGTLILGAKTYLVDAYTWDGGAGNGGAIIGHGPKSILKYRVATVGLTALIFARNIDSLTLKNFTIAGDGVLSQRGVLLGVADSTAPQNTTIEGVTFKNLALSGVHTTNAPNATSQVCLMTDCRFDTCGIGIVGGAQMALTNVNVSSCTTGLQVSAGNLTMVGCVVDNNGTGLQLVAAGNDGHGTVTGCTFNHNTVLGIEVQDVANGMTFSGCHVYANSVSFDNVGIVDLIGCSLRPVVMTFTDPAIVRFVECRIESSSWTTLTIADTCAVEFINCRDLDGTVPSKIRNYVQNAFTFAGDANDTLTKQESVAESLIIAAGVISAGRNLTSALAPAGATTRRIYLRNDNAQAVTYKWSTGTGVTVATGKTALIGSDGTNAVALMVGA